MRRPSVSHNRVGNPENSLIQRFGIFQTSRRCSDALYRFAQEVALTKKIIDSGNISLIAAGQVDTDDTVLSGGTLDVGFGGSAIDTTILGNETVLGAGSDSGALIQ